MCRCRCVQRNSRRFLEGSYHRVTESTTKHNRIRALHGLDGGWRGDVQCSRTSWGETFALAPRYRGYGSRQCSTAVWPLPRTASGFCRSKRTKLHRKCRTRRKYRKHIQSYATVSIQRPESREACLIITATLRSLDSKLKVPIAREYRYTCNTRIGS